MAAEETPQAARLRAGVLRAAVLDDYMRHGDHTRASAEAAAAAMGVSIARFYALRRAYGAARTIESVTPRAPEGGRGKGRIDPALDRALHHALVTRYFIGSQPSASRFFDQFCGEYLYGQGVVDPDTGEMIGLGLQLAEDRTGDPPEPLSLTTVRRRVAAQDARTHAVRVLGKKEARHRFTFKRRDAQVVEAPLERAQIDHTVLNRTFRAPDGKLLRAHITMIIDLFTRGPLGWYVGVEAPSQFTVAMAMLHAVTDKEAAARSLSPRYRNPFIGLTKTLHSDHAKEFYGLGFLAGCQRNGIEFVEKGQKGVPHIRGIVERRFLTEAHDAAAQPGATGANRDQAKALRDSPKGFLSLEELRADISLSICSRYNVNPVGDAPPPALAFDAAAGTLPDIYRRWTDQDRFNLFVSFLPLKEATLQNTGLRADIDYADDALRATFDRDLKRKIALRIDPRNRHIIYIPDGDGFRSVPAVDPDITTPAAAEAAIARVKARRRAARDSADRHAAYDGAARRGAANREAEARVKTAAQARKAEARRIAAQDAPPPRTAPDPAQPAENKVIVFEPGMRKRSFTPNCW